MLKENKNYQNEKVKISKALQPGWLAKDSQGTSQTYNILTQGVNEEVQEFQEIRGNINQSVNCLQLMGFSTN